MWLYPEKWSVQRKADRKKKLFDNLIPYFEGVEVIVPFNQSPKTVRVRVIEKDRRKEIYCDTLLTLTKTKKTPYFYFFYIYNRGLLSFKNENPCRRLEVVNTNQTSRYAYKELTYEFDRFYSWRYDYRDNSFMKLYWSSSNFLFYNTIKCSFTSQQRLPMEALRI